MQATLQELYNAVRNANEEYNGHVDQFNHIADELVEANAEIKVLVERTSKDWELLKKQEAIIESALIVTKKDRAELNIAQANFKELQRLDPKRLVKQNKGYKKTIEELKERLNNSETARKTAIKHSQAIKGVAKKEGNAAFHFDPITKNAIRLIPSLYVGKTNEFNGVIGSPVIEYMNHAKGITRQGTLLNDGTVGWANAKNSTPNLDESRVAREFLFEWCKQNKVKTEEAA